MAEPLNRRASLTLSHGRRVHHETDRTLEALEELADVYPLSEPSGFRTEAVTLPRSQSAERHDLRRSVTSVELGSIERLSRTRTDGSRLSIVLNSAPAREDARLEESRAEAAEFAAFEPAEPLQGLSPVSIDERAPASVELGGEEKEPEPPEPAPLVVDIPQPPLAIHAVLIPASIIGYLLRAALSLSPPFTAAATTATFYPNFVGCIIMGFFQAGREYFWRLGPPVSGHGWLWWFAICTGLCGSLTTWSSWQVATFNAFAGSDGSGLPVQERLVKGIGDLAFGAATFVAGIVVGSHLWQGAEAGFVHFRRSRAPIVVGDADKEPEKPDAGGVIASVDVIEPAVEFRFVPLGWTGLDYSTWAPSDYLLLLTVVSSIAAIVAVLAVDSSGSLEHGRTYGFGMLFAPIGTTVRYKLSRYNIPVARKGPLALFPATFPVGTFTANVVGTSILAAMYTVARTVPLGPFTGQKSDTYQCALIGAAADGFCGCLTTISTFCFEVVTLMRLGGRGVGTAYTYGAISAAASLAVCTCVIGAVYWSRGWGGSGVYCS
ncbi:CrcB-like protein-domain-containing protein [Hyaloraphidium curvatum]|nr:CrcB-like protein-domain-containing protein [Hyaloraphidium curvatum]